MGSGLIELTLLDRVAEVVHGVVDGLLLAVQDGHHPVCLGAQGRRVNDPADLLEEVLTILGCLVQQLDHLDRLFARQTPVLNGLHSQVADADLEGAQATNSLRAGDTSNALRCSAPARLGLEVLEVASLALRRCLDRTVLSDELCFLLDSLALKNVGLRLRATLRLSAPGLRELLTQRLCLLGGLDAPLLSFALK